MSEIISSSICSWLMLHKCRTALCCLSHCRVTFGRKLTCVCTRRSFCTIIYNNSLQAVFKGLGEETQPFEISSPLFLIKAPVWMRKCSKWLGVKWKGSSGSHSAFRNQIRPRKARPCKNEVLPHIHFNNFQNVWFYSAIQCMTSVHWQYRCRATDLLESIV